MCSPSGGRAKQGGLSAKAYPTQNPSLEREGQRTCKRQEGRLVRGKGTNSDLGREGSLKYKVQEQCRVWAAHSAAQSELALLTYPNAVSSARQVKSVFREGTRQETGLQRGKEQREEHLVGDQPSPCRR